MPNINSWLTTSTPISATDRAVDAWRRISQKPTSITLVRNGVAQSAQTLRVEADNMSSEVEGLGMGQSSWRRVILFGVRSHPTVTDTNIQRDDRFALSGTQYRVVDVNATNLGEVQATAEAQQ